LEQSGAAAASLSIIIEDKQSRRPTREYIVITRIQKDNTTGSQETKEQQVSQYIICTLFIHRAKLEVVY
jgi:hypothetical protein